MVTEYLYHVVDAIHIRNIGEQSVSNKIQAVLELVKNAYDADAKTCTVTFHGEKNQANEIKIYKISIEDCGIGMTKMDLKTKMMTVGTAHKTREKFSPKLKRRVSGEKGMGHYSVQRLGDKVTITTTPEPFKGRKFAKSDSTTFVLEMDWKKYKAGHSFEKVPNKLLTTKMEKNFGTKIEITELKDDWKVSGDNNDLLLLDKNLRNLVLPKELQKGEKDEFLPVIASEGFEIKLPTIEGSLLDYALYKIVSHLRGKRLSYKIFKRPKNKSEFVQIEDNAKTVMNTKCGDADLTVYWFPGLVTNWATGVTKPRLLKDQLDENYGIKIYNDKVRIMPYGEVGNDWLGLDARKGGPQRGGKVRNTHLIGFLKLSRKGNPDIIETTTRQAINENAAFLSLKNDFAMRVIEELEEGVRKVVKEEKEQEKKLIPANIAQIEIGRIREDIEQSDISTEKKNEYIKKLTKISKNIVLSEKETEEFEEQLTSNLEMYRNLSTVGIQTLAFNHEIINPIRFVNGTLTNFILPGATHSKSEIISEIKTCLEQIENSLHWANSVKEFSSLLAGSDVAKKKTHIIDMEKTINTIRKGFSPVFETLGIVMEDPVFIGEIPKIKMSLASFESILINLISNSIRSLKRVTRQRRIKVEVSKDDSNILIQFEDNGYGIPDENIERIFIPLFTTYTDDADKGTGMGLAIIKEIVEDTLGGKVSLKKTVYEETDEGKGMAVFLIQIPRRSVDV